MARPKKKTVDYFPHIVKNGKTMTILENKFGNDGYAFWFKLLEILASTDGHFYDYNNPFNQEFLYAKTRLNRDMVEEILNLLAKLESIDPKAWEKGIIWSKNFVENISEVYKRRGMKIPQNPIKEVSDNKNPAQEEFLTTKTPMNEISDNRNRQSKVKYSKLEKNKVRTSKLAQKTEVVVSQNIPDSDESGDRPSSTLKNHSPKKNQSHTPYEKVIELYHSLCPNLPKVIKITPKRKKHIKAIFGFLKNLGAFESYFRKVSQSNFLSGSSGKWQANFDWLINTNNAVKVLEGCYDDRASPGGNGRQEQKAWTLEEYAKQKGLI